MTSLLRMEGVALRRGGRMLVEGLSVTLAPGEALQLAGPNGSGKTSLIRLIAGLLRPSVGKIERGAVALADENAALDRELPLRNALAFWGGSRIDAAMAAFAIDRLVEVPCRLLSAGQLKRATLARVMASDAPLWLLDEPQNGLDRAGLQRLSAAIEGHRRAGGAIVAASHSTLAGQWRTLDLGQGVTA